MSIQSDVQKLEPGNKIRLVEVDCTGFQPSTPILRFHCNNIPFTEAEIKAAGGDTSKLKAKSVYFGYHDPRKTQPVEYGAWPYEITGIAVSSDGQTADPTLRVANLDGSISKLCLELDDMVQAKVTITDTFSHYLNGGASADASQCYQQIWYIDSKTSEDSQQVEFKLSSPFDLQGLVIPTRQITTLCTWACRNQYKAGNGCSYDPARHSNRMFTEKGVATSDPSKDKCSGYLEDCQKRFGKNNVLDFGGFPGASLLRR